MLRSFKQPSFLECCSSTMRGLCVDHSNFHKAFILQTLGLQRNTALAVFLVQGGPQGGGLEVLISLPFPNPFQETCSSGLVLLLNELSSTTCGGDDKTN